MIILVNAVALAAAQPAAQPPAAPAAHSEAMARHGCCCCCCCADMDREGCAEHAQHRGQEGHD
jgi:hypothetical protein